jgi:hypothetical protein
MRDRIDSLRKGGMTKTARGFITWAREQNGVIRRYGSEQGDQL